MRHPYKLAPIERSVLRVLEHSKSGETEQSIADCIRHTSKHNASEWVGFILRRFMNVGMAERRGERFYVVPIQ